MTRIATAGTAFDGASSLLEALAEQNGLVLSENEDLAPRTTFHIGGPAEIFAEANSEEALSALIAEVDVIAAPFFMLGVGSNVLLPDAGLPGVVAKLGGGFGRISFDGEEVRVGGSASLSKLARAACSRGLLGLEALAGFPATVGGAVRMNAGSYGSQILDVLTAIRAVDQQGRIETLRVEDLRAGYRTTSLQKTGHIVIEAHFLLRRGDAEAASARIAELNRKRWKSLPSGVRSVGSIFRNPEAASAGSMIDECGLKGKTVGGAQISAKHGNVIINTGGGRAADVLELMIEAYRAVLERFDISLKPEVVLAGALKREWEERTAEAAERVKDSIADEHADL
jgi:UDP-N-acetylmuramate dehydrogenase